MEVVPGAWYTEGVFDRPANLGARVSSPTRIAPLSNRKEKKMKNIFVGNLSFRTTEQDIRTLFEVHGSVDRVNIVTDRDSGQPRGFGFVEMTNDAEGNRAIGAINGKEVGGRMLNVNEARPKSEDGGRGFGGGGRGRY
jgi:cold-inducible RNA-binding protein